MGFGTEGATLEFVDGMDQLDDALKAMTAMLNRSNRATVLIGVGDDGEALGIDLCADDIDIIEQRMLSKLNHRPAVSISLESTEDGRRYIRISATGYETPYAFGSWFYIRKCIYSKSDDGVDEEWIQTLTCSMKRH